MHADISQYVDIIILNSETKVLFLLIVSPLVSLIMRLMIDQIRSLNNRGVRHPYEVGCIFDLFGIGGKADADQLLSYCI